LMRASPRSPPLTSDLLGSSSLKEMEQLPELLHCALLREPLDHVIRELIPDVEHSCDIAGALTLSVQRYDRLRFARVRYLLLIYLERYLHPQLLTSRIVRHALPPFL